METYKRKCIENWEFKFKSKNGEEHTIKLEKDKEYITSKVMNEKLMVFTTHWYIAPSELFDEGIKFT